MSTNGYRMNLAMEFQSLRINWELILLLYYSTRNGFIKRKLCVPSGSLIYNQYYSRIYISKMENFLRFKKHKTTISTELSNLNTIQIQFMIYVRIIWFDKIAAWIDVLGYILCMVSGSQAYPFFFLRNKAIFFTYTFCMVMFNGRHNGAVQGCENKTRNNNNVQIIENACETFFSCK